MSKPKTDKKTAAKTSSEAAPIAPFPSVHDSAALPETAHAETIVYVTKSIASAEGVKAAEPVRVTEGKASETTFRAFKNATTNVTAFKEVSQETTEVIKDPPFDLENSFFVKKSPFLDKLSLVGIFFSMLVGTVSTFLRAFLFARPLLNISISASTTALISAGAFVSVGRVPLYLVVPLGLFGTVSFDVFYWLAGVRFRHRLRKDVEKYVSISAKRIDQGERLMKRFGAKVLVVRYFLPIPSALLMLFAGSGGMKFWKFMLADILGGALFAFLMIFIGYSVGESAVEVVDVISKNALKVTISLAVLLFFWNFLKAFRTAKARNS